MGKICVEENENSYEQAKNCLGLERYYGLTGTVKRIYLCSIFMKLFN